MSSFYDFPQDEIDAVTTKFPNLKLEKQGVWEGKLDVFAQHGDYVVNEVFEIRITASGQYPAQLPVMKEIGGRTSEIAKKYNITDLRDLHCNPVYGNTVCLCIPQEEKENFPPGSNLITFIGKLVIPYLYGLSFFEKEGYWPWGEYSHGSLGLLEFHAEDPMESTEESVRNIATDLRADESWKYYHKQLKKPSGDRMCICNSRKPFRKCHKKVWQGLLRFYSDLDNLNLNINQLFQR